MTGTERDTDGPSMRFFFSGERRCHPTLKLVLKSPCTRVLFSKLSLRKSAVQTGTGAVPIAGKHHSISNTLPGDQRWLISGDAVTAL